MMLSPPVLSSCDRPPPCTVEVLRNPRALDGLREEWDNLFATSPTAAPPLRWEWVRTWWQVYGPHYGDRGRGLRVLIIRGDGRLLGVLPLYLGRQPRFPFAPRRLRFISTGAAEFEETCTEYLNLLHAPGAGPACIETIAPVLCSPGQLGWDELHFPELPPDSPLLTLSSHFRGSFLQRYSGPLRSESDGSPEVCYLFSMEGGFEGYLKRLSHENRRQARKMLRDVAAEGMEFEVAANAEQLGLFFDQMVALHRQRWTAKGKAGSFGPRHSEFHRKTAELLLGRGEALIARLSHQGRPLAVAFGYRVRDRVHCYQQGVSEGVGRVRSPGTAVWLSLMVHQAERGVTLFDHQKGLTQFKERFATNQGLSPNSV